MPTNGGGTGLPVNRMTDPVSISEWIAYGVEKGFCSPLICATHDGIPSTPEEAAEWEDGGDPCQPVVRLLEPGMTLLN